MTALTPDPLWTELTHQTTLEEQYEAMRSKPTANDKGTAFALARFAETQIYTKADRHIAAQVARIEQLERIVVIAQTDWLSMHNTVMRLQEQLATAQQQYKPVPDEVRQTVEMALEFAKRRFAENERWHNGFGRTSQSQLEQIDTALDWLHQQKAMPQPTWGESNA